MRKRKTGQNLHLSNLNFKIIIYALILSIIGIFMVHSATQNEAVTGMITTNTKADPWNGHRTCSYDDSDMY